MSNDNTKATIYRIIHTESGRMYVGHTSNAIRKRFYRHRNDLRKNKHHSPFLQNAWNKYGEDAFLFEVIEICDEELKLIREQFHIDSMNAVFNYAKIAGSRKGVPQSAETIEKVRQSLMGNQYTKGRVVTDPEELESRAKHHRGRKRPAETGERISEALMGNQNCLGREVSEETRLKIKLATDDTRPTMQGKHHTEESKQKSSASNKAFIEANGHHRTGSHHTEETKAKMSAAQKGRPGKEASEETKAKMREAHARRRAAGLSPAPVSDETREKMRQAQLGKKHSAERSQQKSERQKGRKLGPASEEAKANMRAAKALRRELGLKPKARPPITEEAREKMRASRAAYLVRKAADKDTA